MNWIGYEAGYGTKLAPAKLCCRSMLVQLYLTMPHEVEESFCNCYAVVLIGQATAAVRIYIVRKDASFMSVGDDLINDFCGELWVALNGNVPTRAIHCLDGAYLVAAQRNGILGEF